MSRCSTRHGGKDISRAETLPATRAGILMEVVEFRTRKNPRRARVHSSAAGLQTLQVALRQLGGRAARILSDDLLEYPASLVVVAQATLDIG